MDTTTHTVTSVDGTTITYDRSGSGPAVILVAGAFSYRKFPMLPKLAAQLAQQFTVINYDRRGRGDSTDTQPYAIEREIEDLHALIEVVGGEADVWGLSSGAALALHAAAANAGIRRLALYQPPFRLEGGGPLPPEDFPAHLDALVAAGRRSEAVKYMMTKGMGAPGWAIAMMRPFPMWKRLTGLAHTLPYDVALVGERMYGKAMTRADFADVKVPALVIAGGKSPAVVRAAVEHVAELLPDAQYRVLAGQSHNLSPAAIAPLLTGFFRR